MQLARLMRSGDLKAIYVPTIAAELGDMTRFDTLRQLAAYVGLHPSEYTSGGYRQEGPDR